MPKPIDLAYEYSADEVGSVLRQIDALRAVFAEFLEELEKQPGKTLAAHNRRTLERGLAHFASVAGALNKSIYAARAGHPLQPGSTKPRSPARARKTARVAETPSKYQGKKPKGKRDAR